MSFLLGATRLLADSLNVESVLASVAHLSLPHLGSWCIVDLCDGAKMRRIAIVHPDPAGQKLADQLLSGWPPFRDDLLGIPSVVRTRRSHVIFSVQDEMLIEAARSAENLAILRALQIGSLVTVPLVARGEVLGAITYVSPNNGHAFSQSDLDLAEDLAARCAIAIDNSRLLQISRTSQQEAEEANRVKMQFLSTMSHELRTPLNAIAGYAELLETGIRGSLTEAQLQDIHRIQANQRHLLGLVETVLSFAKIEAGRIQFGLKDVLLGPILADLEGVAVPLAEQNGVVWVGCDQRGSGAVKVYADADKLCQILINLAANAIKFSGSAGRVEMTIRTAADRVEFHMRDNGPGIAPEHHAAIFEPFTQLSQGYIHTQGGTGLGLAISRRLAEGMGGELAVRSELGHGSTFTLTLAIGRG